MCEKQNLESKELVGDNPTNAQLSKLAGLLNASRHIAPRFQKALGVPHGLDSDEGSQYSHQLDGDKQAVRDFLHTKLGDWQQLCGTSSRQRFQAQAGRRVENPSARVARRAGAASTDGLAASEEDESEDDAKGNSDDDDGQDDDDLPDDNGEDDDDDDDDTPPSDWDGESWADYVKEAQKACMKT